MPVLMTIAEGLDLRTGGRFISSSRNVGRAARPFSSQSARSRAPSCPSSWDCCGPKFMEKAGAIIGMPFSLEGFAFFTEAIFLGVCLAGWNRLPPLLHWLSGLMVAIGGIASGITLVTANAWMNAPAGFQSRRRQNHRHRPGRSDAESGKLPRSRAHDAGRFYRNRFRGGSGPRFFSAAGSAQSISSERVRVSREGNVHFPGNWFECEWRVENRSF